MQTVPAGNSKQFCKSVKLLNVRELQQFQSSIMMEKELLVRDKKAKQSFLTISFTVINAKFVFINASLPGKLTLVQF